MRADDLRRVVDTMHRAQHGSLQVRACVRDAQEHVLAIAGELDAVARIASYSAVDPARRHLNALQNALIAMQGHLDQATGELVSDLHALTNREAGF